MPGYSWSRTPRHALCVGGPYDGKMHAHDGPLFSVALMRGVTHDYVPVQGPVSPVYHRMTYHEQIWYTNDGQTVVLWTPEGQSAHETMLMLVAGYKSAARATRD